MIKNITSKKIICNKSKILTSIFQKAVGLMFHKKIQDTGFIFVFDKPQIVSLHMFFVFFSIDVIYLDKEKKVVEIKRKFRPFTLYTPKKKASYVIELPCGKAGNINIKDYIFFN